MMNKDIRLKEALYKAYIMLTRRARSEQELRLKLTQKGFSHPVVDEAIETLRGAGYLNDEAYAQEAARGLVLNRRLGNRLIEMRLRERGLSPAHISAALKEARKELNESESIRQYLKKERDKSPTWNMAGRRRIANRLISRGYPAGLVLEIMREHKEELLDDPEG